MSLKDIQKNLLMRVLDAVQISKEILQKVDKINSNQRVLEEMRVQHNAMNNILKHDFTTAGFLDERVIVGRLGSLGASEAHIVSMVTIINLSLAAYKILSKTQLQSVLKCLFTNIIPAGTDIFEGIDLAYKALLHAAVMGVSSQSARKSLTRKWHMVIRRYVPFPEDLDIYYFQQLTQLEIECLQDIRDNIQPVDAAEYTTLWASAILSMVSQTWSVTNMLISTPTYLINLANGTTDGIPEAESEADTEIEVGAESENEDIFFNSVQQQSDDDDDDDEVFVDAVYDQQPTTEAPPPSNALASSSSISHQAPTIPAVSRKRKNDFDSEDLSQSQNASTSQEESTDAALSKKRKTVTDANMSDELPQSQHLPTDDTKSPSDQSISIKKTFNGAISKPSARARLRQLIKKWL